MKKRFLKPIVLGLIVMLIFNFTPSAFANQTEHGLSETMNNLSKTEQRDIKIILKHSN